MCVTYGQKHFETTILKHELYLLFSSTAACIVKFHSSSLASALLSAMSHVGHKNTEN